MTKFFCWFVFYTTLRAIESMVTILPALSKVTQWDHNLSDARCRGVDVADLIMDWEIRVRFPAYPQHVQAFCGKEFQTSLDIPVQSLGRLGM